MVTLETILQVIPAISVSIAAIYYAINIRHQRETRQAQLFMQFYTLHISEEWQDASRHIQHVVHWKDFDDFSRLFFEKRPNENLRAFQRLAHYYEGLGVYVKENLINIRLVALLMTGPTRNFWEKVEPIILEHRKRTNNPITYSEMEYLYKTLMAYIEKNPEIWG